MLMVVCPACRGKGARAEAKPARITNEKQCTTCSGTGKVDFYAASDEVREALLHQHAS